MRRFLVVGCGGSGGATLAYMMDQLRSDLAAEGVDRLPRGWQFVHLDVPSGEESGPDGLGNVEGQGGRYIGMGPKAGSYADLDFAVSRKLAANRALGEIATWAPRNPNAVATPISVGAGQYRAVGRMITLNKLEALREGLSGAWDDLHRVETHADMDQIAAQARLGRYSANEVPIVLVVSSMAGGAGASMALDVCRVLTTINGLDPKLMAVFMVSSDIFDSLPESARSGVRSNALAMLGEIVASQTGSSHDHDVDLMNALGQQYGAGTPIPFARVFPVGRYVGAQRTMFGDGSPRAIYRGLARGLSGMVMSEQATDQFVSYDLGNTGSVPPDSSYLGWGAQQDPLPWGSFGFASLSMGRDRYAEYAAQRIARSAVDRLLDGHLQEGNTASGTEQVKALLNSQWARLCADIQIFDGAGGQGSMALAQWLMNVALPRQHAGNIAAQIVNQGVISQLPPPDGMEVNQWAPILSQVLNSRRTAMSEATGREAYNWAFDWHQQLLQRLMATIGTAIANLGLPYAAAVIDRLQGHLKESVIPAANELKQHDRSDIAELPPRVGQGLAGIKGKIAGGQQILNTLAEDMTARVIEHVYAKASGMLADVLSTFVGDVLVPLGEAIHEQQRLLEQARASAVRHDGLARLATDQYSAWPSDDDQRAPERFDEANNEVLLTSSQQFLPQYLADIQGAIPTEVKTFPAARAGVVTRVIQGLWETTGGMRPPGGLLEQTHQWAARVFPTHPGSGESIVPMRARFNLHARPREVLERARLFVARPEESFHRFCSMSLRDFVRGVGAQESERQGRIDDIAAKFNQTLTLALPLISANDAAVQLLHGGKNVEYRYKFSAVPFADLPIADALERVIVNNPQIDSSTRDNFRKSVNDSDHVRRLDILGSYPLYAPICFDSVLRPVAEQWSTTSPAGREAFWTYRRARPLNAALPMAEAERRAMCAGWFLGQGIGAIRIPESPYVQAVEVFDVANRQWLEFPNPLLTPPERFQASYDWLPAVLESSLLAISRSHQNPPMASLLPYRALRGLFDASPLGPAAGIVERSGKNLLVDYLRTGTIGSGATSRVPGAAEATDVDGRAEALTTFFTQIRDLAGVHFMAPGQAGAPGGGTFSLVTDRGVASQAPIFRDLAPDIWWACGELIDMVADAAVRAKQPAGTSRQGPLTPETQKLEMPGMPGMGAF
ncbi:tubulin-like doman-containing protein [Granulicoccus phenolivorans]|uniref:tubulin-like doman-containing protein n=1 Tax=Granulicoccus phenolivorans TaxID=266854 RepID=UPI0006891C2C|nr:tubulin-like doman-containing protein [Granulicoccus phenolivorans]